MTVDEELPNIEVFMARPDLSGLPKHELPAGYSIRVYQPGDEAAWVRIHELADRYNKVTLETFESEFGYDLDSFRSRGFFLIGPNGETVGTASAWYDNEFEGETWGRVHWVAIRPEHQGKGLSKPLLARVLHRLAEDHSKCYLVTSSARIPAISLYLRFGFRPLMRTQTCSLAWDSVKGKIPDSYSMLLNPARGTPI
ncbi:MAG: Mycothiol acetyltransferase [bacterium]|nr:Mycothiol acetyltransferase [bacterium]